MTDTAERGTPPGIRRDRADRRRNREALLAAARDAFVELGPEAPLDDIARRAGVGNATLYRHFANRATLERAVLVAVSERLVREAERAGREEQDGLAALRRFARAAARERVAVLGGLLLYEGGRDPELAEWRARLLAAVRALVERAHRARRLRAEVAPEDLLVALVQLSRPLPGPRTPDRDRLTDRALALFVDGLACPPLEKLSPSPGPGWPPR
ncbi:TetR family transcriptional regulator [Streptomyces sp. 3MP-14]|uniref:TetR family transcriptional regulator n=1 Tax=Streptomyces mimosae TaxID=2586635 RepID=A0A5N6ALA3_9ACTN|nr:MULTISPECIES: TetR/AcrR family transcriptional regulator [Streptomyces]KAB8169637.1 TetR family transcriptional regulator [Streptomyces mimosae]KAB8178385.1 TetR family transcriptional regulator [Streptomyces sp. 3MP-14]